MTYVNLGCGTRYHSDWLNFDIIPASPDVIAADLSKGIPLDNAQCDVVYHSHVLEHLRRSDVPAFLQECLRVLRPGGVIRIVVPDLERIAREYLRQLDAAERGETLAAENYEWMVLELYDQTVREQGGGRKVDYLARPQLPNKEFVYSWIGEDGREMIEKFHESSNATSGEKSGMQGWPQLRHRIAKRLIRMLMRFDGNAESYMAWLTPESRRALEIGRFRLAGEVHQWMYDRYSLARLLGDIGFVDARQVGATESAIEGWESFNLDTNRQGLIYKPDSLFMEAIKPGEQSREGAARKEVEIGI